jgi:hypothetical protein
MTRDKRWQEQRQRELDAARAEAQGLDTIEEEELAIPLGRFGVDFFSVEGSTLARKGES